MSPFDCGTPQLSLRAPQGERFSRDLFHDTPVQHHEGARSDDSGQVVAIEAEPQPLLSQPHDPRPRLFGDLRRLPELPALRPHNRQPGLRSLADEPAFKLRHGHEHDRREFATAGLVSSVSPSPAALGNQSERQSGSVRGRTEDRGNPRRGRLRPRERGRRVMISAAWRRTPFSWPGHFR